MKISAITDVGMVRPENQDFLYVSEGAVGPLPNLCILADGMGGHRAGDLASRTAVESMLRHLSAAESAQKLPALLQEGLQQANEEVLRLSSANEAYRGMGTTLVACVSMDRELTVLNVGDSRLYLFRDGELLQITRDHSYVEEMIRQGQMKKDSAEYRMYKNLITRAVGIDPRVEADLFEVELLAGDLILLCSDGLTNMVEDEEIRILLGSSASLEEKAGLLVRLAKENGGRDNISVILADPEEAAVC